MKITGLSNQWGERLWDISPRPGKSPGFFQYCNQYIRQLLQHLTTIEGPDLWVGTSHSQLNFCARDTTFNFDSVPSLAYLDSIYGSFRIQYHEPREFRTWKDAMVVGQAQSVEDAAAMLLMAIASSDANPSRPSAQWKWYVCPQCDYHALEYSRKCLRCRYAFPSELKAQLIGMYRTPLSPEGAIAPRNTSKTSL